MKLVLGFRRTRKRLDRFLDKLLNLQLSRATQLFPGDMNVINARRCIKRHFDCRFGVVTLDYTVI